MSSPAPRHQVVLVRHGETEWSTTGRHTGTTDLPLTQAGRETARRLRARLAARTFAAVWTSPRARARETADLAGFGARTEVVPDIVEWNYGEYEGLTTVEIRARQPNWSVWRDGCPGGESAADVGMRADRAVERLRASSGEVLLFSHAHFLRTLAARWIEMPPTVGERLWLTTGAICVLGWEREVPVIQHWNQQDSAHVRS
ncbi:MAG: histidine phosphatase family protein [Planctomycetota bacterium]